MLQKKRHFNTPKRRQKGGKEGGRKEGKDELVLSTAGCDAMYFCHGAWHAHHYSSHQLSVPMAGQGWEKWDIGFLLSQCLFQKKCLEKQNLYLIQNRPVVSYSLFYTSGPFWIVINPRFLICKSKSWKTLKSHLAAKLDPLNIYSCQVFHCQILQFDYRVYSMIFYKIQ